MLISLSRQRGIGSEIGTIEVVKNVQAAGGDGVCRRRRKRCIWRM